MAQFQRWARRRVRVLSDKVLVQAALHGKIEVMRILVSDLGANANRSHLGITPLYVAAQNGQLAAVVCLVNELDAHVDLANDDGTTSLMIAAERGHLSVMQCLIMEFGADVDRAMKDGRTPLRIAVKKGNLAMVRCLV
jgi:ankyrin repeat protein